MTIDISQETATPPAIPVTKQPADVADDSSSTASFASLKDRIKSHYDICSNYYLSLWGQHIHHASSFTGYWTPETVNLTKEIAQVHLIELLLCRAGYPCNPEYAQQLGLPSHLQPASKSTNEQPRKLRVLDVGCGVGGTTRYLAEQRGWDVTGVTISSEQIKIAYELTDKLVSSANGSSTTQTAATGQNRSGEKISVGKGSVQYIQLDAEKMGDHFPHGTFDIVWISEALSHLPNKDLFFRSSSLLLKDQNDNNSTEKEKGKLVIADWLKAPNLTQKQFDEDIEPIEVGMLLPPLDTMDGYLNKAEQNGLRVRQGGEAMDISANVKRTWDISLSLIQSPSLWAFAFSQGRDVVAFLRAFQAMRRGFGNGNFRYGVVVFEKEG